MKTYEVLEILQESRLVRYLVEADSPESARQIVEDDCADAGKTIDTDVLENAIVSVKEAR